MLVQIRKKGQLTLPAALLRRLSIGEGDRLECRVEDGVLLLLPVPPRSTAPVKKN